MTKRFSPGIGAILCFAMLIVTSPVFSQNQVDIPTHLRITTAVRASEPVITGEQILFSYLPDTPVRHIGIAFSHEAYARVHNLERNSNGVYVILYRPPAGTTILRYRFVVDGLWMTDPMNPSVYVDSKGIKLSVFRFPGAFPVVPESPVVTDTGVVELNLYATSGMHVYVTGNFANWDPFIYRVPETNPGLYQFAIPLPPGMHWYQFVVDGMHITDPLNPATATRGDGKRVSVVVVDR